MNLFEQFLREKRCLSNVSKNIIKWYEASYLTCTSYG